MAAYFIVNCTITDQAKLDAYIAGAGASLGVVPLKLLAMDNASEAVEGTPAGSRTVVLEFDNKDDFRTWYNSAEYQGVIGMRFEATEGFGVLVNGA
ncbi:MAG: DUF1330 domain-containing protein [Acidimicrobiia bacterium]|nr:DUF1330 domain-containing protein [Acidimicrobiia bacterium]